MVDVDMSKSKESTRVYVEVSALVEVIGEVQITIILASGSKFLAILILID